MTREESKKRRQRVIDFLKENKEGADVNTLATVFGTFNNNMAKTLYDMKDKGFISGTTYKEKTRGVPGPWLRAKSRITKKKWYYHPENHVEATEAIKSMSYQDEK